MPSFHPLALGNRNPLNRSPNAKNADDLRHQLSIKVADMELRPPRPVTTLAQMDPAKARAIVEELEAREAARPPKDPKRKLVCKRGKP